MYYEINVAKAIRKTYEGGPMAYRHLFATTKRSCLTEHDAAVVLDLLTKAFPEPEYNISVTRWEDTGYGVDKIKLLKTLKKKK